MSTSRAGAAQPAGYWVLMARNILLSIHELTFVWDAISRAQGQHPAARAAAAARAQEPVQPAVGGAARRERSRRPLPGHAHIFQRRPVWPGLNSCPSFVVRTAVPVLRSAKALQHRLGSSTLGTSQRQACSRVPARRCSLCSSQVVAQSGGATAKRNAVQAHCDLHRCRVGRASASASWSRWTSWWWTLKRTTGTCGS